MLLWFIFGAKGNVVRKFHKFHPASENRVRPLSIIKKPFLCGKMTLNWCFGLSVKKKKKGRNKKINSFIRENEKWGIQQNSLQGIRPIRNILLNLKAYHALIIVVISRDFPTANLAIWKSPHVNLWKLYSHGQTFDRIWLDFEQKCSGSCQFAE